ncbi:MAG: hypothetical protein GF405_02775 [Candidatus Eisenbacteria bacterium]|nr:hypothetical protein [Candidatus Eisenbacteria bacterium]
MRRGTVAIDASYNEILRRIADVGARRRGRQALAGLLEVLAFLLAASATVVLLDVLVGLAAVVRTSLALAVLAGLVGGLAVRVGRPLARRLGPQEIAARIEERHPEMGERLRAAAGLWAKRGRGRHGYSVELIDALIDEAAGLVLGRDIRDAAAVRGLGRRALVLLVVLAVSVAAVGATGTDGVAAVGRLREPWRSDVMPRVTLSVTPGDTTLVSGSSLRVRAVVRGPEDDAPLFVTRDRNGAATERTMTRTDDGYRATVSDVREPLSYSVAAGETTSDEFDVAVLERPFVSGVRLAYEFPEYSGLVPRTVDENNGDITALAGTRVQVGISGSKPLESAVLRFEDGGALDLERMGPASFSGTLTVSESQAYSIEIEDTLGLANAGPPTYSISAIPDESPLVTIVEPGRDIEIPNDMLLDIAVSAIDDYGVSGLRIRYAVDGLAEEGVVPLPHAGGREVVSEITWDLSETGILPGSVLIYFAEVVDNDTVTGPKTARSERYIVRFPSMAEMYAEVTGEEDAIVEELDELVEDQQEVSDELEEIRNEIRSEPELDWQRQEEVEAALDRQEEVAERAEEMAERMEELGERMSETDRVTLETLEKVQEISEILDEVANDEMRELMEQIREAMADLDPEEVSRSMNDMSVTQEDYRRRLEQTLNLLKRVRAEQQLADAASRAEELAAREERLAREAREASPGEQCDAMASEQRDIREQTEKLRRDLEQAISDMEQVDSETSSDMREAADSLDESGTIEKMSQAQQKLAESMPSEAAAQCESSANDLKSLFTRLSSCQGGASCSLQQRDREATLRAIDELLGVSNEQEEILGSVKDRRRIPRDELVELVAKQTDLAASMSKIAERMFRKTKDSFAVDPGLYRGFGIVEMHMMRAAGSIADGGTQAGRREAEAALGRVNGLVVELLTTKQSQSSSSGGAMQQLMQQLRQMAQSQSQLNQMTEQLRRQSEESGMGSEVRRQLADMRARQERLMDEARRLAEEFGDREEILGSLDETANEMEKTLEEMERSGASQETIDRQKRILSRLLDAQRSLRRRDYTRRRRSESGEDYVRESPGALPEELERASEKLREDLLRAMQQEYPSEYRELIRAYFESLSGETGSDGEGDAAP